MESKSLSLRAIFKKTFTRPFNLLAYLFIIVSILAISFVTTYLNYTDYSIIGVLIFIFLLIPLLVVYTEYTALFESGARPPRTFKTFLDLYKNTFRSGRLRLLYTWKTILFFLLYLIVTGMIFTIGLSLFIYFFDQTTLNAFQVILNDMAQVNSPEELNAIVTRFSALFDPYLPAQMLFNQVVIIIGIFFVTNKAMFNIYAAIFIEHRPTTKFSEVKEVLLSSQNDRKKVRAIQFNNLLLGILLYLLIYIGAFLLINFFNPNINIFLQIELIGLLVIGVLLPFAARFNYFLFQDVMEKNRREVLVFALNELKAIVMTPNIPEQTKNYLIGLINIREEELKSLNEVVPPKGENKE